MPRYPYEWKEAKPRLGGSTSSSDIFDPADSFQLTLTYEMH